MKDRLKKLRKVLDLTQQEIADRIGIKRNSYANYETGRNVPIDAIILSICREFNVNEIWLRTGAGDMFQESNEKYVMDAIDRIMSGENEFHKNLFKTFAHLDEKELAALESILDKFLKLQNLHVEKLFPASDIPDTPEELEALFPPIELEKDDAV